MKAASLPAKDEVQFVRSVALAVEVEVLSVEAEGLFEGAGTRSVAAALLFVEDEACFVKAEMLLVETAALFLGVTAGLKAYSSW